MHKKETQIVKSIQITLSLFIFQFLPKNKVDITKAFKTYEYIVGKLLK